MKLYKVLYIYIYKTKVLVSVMLLHFMLSSYTYIYLPHIILASKLDPVLPTGFDCLMYIT